MKRGGGPRTQLPLTGLQIAAYERSSDQLPMLQAT
jgi:hypothetical protein